MDRVEQGVEWIHRRYGSVLEWALGHRKNVIGISIGALRGELFAACRSSARSSCRESDQGFISLRLNTPVGSSLEYTDGKVRQVGSGAKQFPESRWS